VIAVLLRATARCFGVVGGLLAIAVAAVTVASIIGRSFFAYPIPGDVELAQLGIALSISLCLPWAQLKRANIIVDFFTQKLAAPARHTLDGIGAILLALMCALLAWRTTVGAISTYQANDSSAILELPGWIIYAGLAPGLGLTAAIALWQAAAHFSGRDVELQVEHSHAPTEPV
jgi:TRAP-type C4-dicarboxylate transport system permease small subunit